MSIVSIVASIVSIAANTLFYVFWARIVLDFVRQLRRDWKPRGFWLAVSVTILAITDPILRVARRVIKPVRVGQVQVDLAVFVVMVLLLVIAGIMAFLI